MQVFTKMTKIKITSKLRLSSVDRDALQSLIPFTITDIEQGDILVVTVAETVTQEQVDAIIDQMKYYVLTNLFTGEIISSNA